MKIGVLTYYGVHSHGAVLQANALKTVLEELGHEVVFLAFERNYDLIDEGQIKKYRISLKSIPFYIKYLFQKGTVSFLRNIKKKNTLKKYKKKNFIMGPRYTDFDGDLVIIGSDEVFSMEIGINPFMYGHGFNKIILASYAGSFGPTTIDEIDNLGERELVLSGLNRLKYISVRDMNSFDIIKTLTGRKAQIVCDPVILYGYKNQIKLKRPRKGKYILVYSYDRNMNEPSEVNAIKGFAKKLGCRIIAVGYPHKWCQSYVNTDPDRLIQYINHAEMVITDTFHGSVLSIICNTDFVVKLRNNTNKLGFLLEQYNLQDRIISNIEDIEQFAHRNIDFNAVNQMIDKYREESLQYIKTVIEQDKINCEDANV